MHGERREGCGAGIVGLGAYLPDEVRTNDFFSSHGVQQDAFLDSVDQSTIERAHADRWASQPFRGAVERRVIHPDQESSDMEVQACLQALRASGLAPSEVELLVGYSQVPDRAGPGNHGRVARRLGLPLHATGFTLDSGCASFLTHLNVAASLVSGGEHRLALLYQSNAASRIQDPASTAAPMLGDGAAAQVVGPVPDGFGWIGKVQWLRGELSEGLVLAPADGRARWYEAGDTPVPLRIQSPDLRAATLMGAQAVEFATEACQSLLARCGYAPSDVDFFVCAQPSAWFAQGCVEALGIRNAGFVPPEEHFQRYGHLLAASVSLNLQIAWQSGRLRRGDLVLIYSPGVGFTQAATLVRWWLEPTAPR